MDLYRRQTIQSLHNRLVGQGQSLSDGLTLNHIGSNGAGGDGGSTAEGLELHVLDDLIIIDLQVHLHNIAALGIAYFAYTVSIFNLAYISRI